MNSLVRCLRPRSIFNANKLHSVVFPNVSRTNRLFSATAESVSSKLSIKGTSEYDRVSYNKHQDEFLFMTTLSAPLIETQNRSAIDLVCVLDESGSMSGPPIDLLKHSMKFIASNLTSADRFGCVGYNDKIRIISDMNYMTPTAKQHTLQSIDSMEAGGTTALCQGLETGVNMMRNCVVEDLKTEMNTKHRIQNILLLTDGQANKGYTRPEDIIRALNDKEFADKKRESEQTSTVTSLLDKVRKSIGVIDLMSTADQTNMNKIYSKIPCSVESFGFGEHHDANFLITLSEYCRGLYAYIAEESDIAGTFGEMLGGMLSVVGKDVKIRVKTLSDEIKISKCLAMQSNAAVQLKEIEKNKHYEIQLSNDIQSEENRDLLFELVIPKIDAVDDNWNYMHIECEYFNIISNQVEQVSAVCPIQRPSEIGDAVQTRNYAIDVQYNRIMATDAIKCAMRLADKGDLDGGKKIIQDVKQKISQSVSKNDAYCQSLMKDLDVCIEGMESKAAYESRGSKYGSTITVCGDMQRAYQCGDVSELHSFRTWGTNSKKMWRDKAETETQKQTK